ncbi:uncharacterized protein LOC124452239 [Xenia sp. Carnegie-2017]|uniref:uncharacterized protein LOC124452239 n=1 Tax=Xenia sp. Carnegie-2017 TaxID=2897299 RepID=UPI001F04A598|nr:uncharacterized protein LOC124452239 [Xenia sp. Carnegie-2017]
MLEEIIAFSLSLCSLFTADSPRVSSNRESALENVNFEFERIENDTPNTFINKEYDDDIRDEIFTQNFACLSNQHVISFEDCGNKGKVWKTLWKCLWTCLNIIAASFIPIVFFITLVYVSMNTAYTCLEWQSHNNNTLPLSVKRAHVFGRCVESFVLYLWFPLTMIILFGWKEFKTKFLSAVYVGVIFGELVVIYHLISFQFNVYDAHSYYRIPPSAIFCLSILCCALVVIYHIRVSAPSISYSKGHVIALVLIEFIFGTILTYLYIFLIIPAFNKVRLNLYKFLIATSSPFLALIPTVLCGHMALRRSSEVVNPGRSFVLVYMIRGGVIFLYRTMQTNFKSIWLFGLSLFSAVLNFLKRATQQLRYKIWKRIISALNNLRCFQRLQVLPWNTAHARRLRADLEIQDILFEYNTLVLSQAYFISYQIQSFDVAFEPLLYEFLKRIGIGVLIDFIFNCLSNFVQMYYYNIPISRVWKKYWKRHLLANIFVVFIIIAEFSRELESVFRSHIKQSEESSVKFVVKNCSFF